MANKDSIGNTIKIAFLVCLACSIVVSFSAVSLRPLQKQNQVVEVKKNILAAAGLLQEGSSSAKQIESQFEQIDTLLVNLETGKFSNEVEDLELYDQFKAAKDPAQSVELTKDQDIASIGRMENLSKVYAVKEGEDIKTLILPIRGYGLWSTLYGFVALENDLNTVAGLGFYAHAETPGLGGEVDNPKWKAQWIGKKIFDNSGAVQARVKKGSVNPAIEAEKDHQVDGLSGATLTSNGVTNLVQFWMGNNGFGQFLKNLKAGEA